ncbi:MAG TPA: glycerophosphodiester phosphodiesterase family protein [Bacteroidales bacterium]|nr:glycerophosphodiester phosphodiesterase family protein [Bacteroidales bacterium]
MHFKFYNKQIWVLAMLFMLLYAACQKKDEYTDDTYFGTKVMILGHRGMGEMYQAPGNTLQAIAPAIAIGTDGCEVDIQMTRDTVLVLYHNSLLDSRTTCTGRVYESNWSEIQQCEYNAIQTGIYINAVDSVFKKLPNLGNLYFSFDGSKVDTEAEDQELYQSQYLRAIKRLCEKYHMSDNIFLEGSETLLKKAQTLGLSNKLFLFSYLDENSINVAANNHFFGITTSLDWMVVDTDRAHEKGLYVMVWSPNNYTQNKITFN